MARKKKVTDETEEKKDSKTQGRKYDDTPRGQANKWQDEFDQSKEFHRKWQEQGDVAVTKYLCDENRGQDGEPIGYRLALFTANINTLMSMLYGRVPQVSVDRRWADPNDQVGRVAAEISERILNADIEQQGEDFSCVLRMCLQDRLLPGVGVARVRYTFDAGEETVDESVGNEQAEPYTKSSSSKEWIVDEYVPWKDIKWSPCRYWSEMRWLAFKIYKTKDEVKEFLADDKNGDKIAEDLDYNSKAPVYEAKAKSSSTDEEDWDKAEIWEIWDKINKCVVWFVDGHHRILKQVDDPLELEGFYPCPPFMIANTTTKKYAPKSDYSFASALYREIDRLEERISLLTTAIKVSGVYDKKAGQDIGRLVNETAENNLIPVDSWAVFQERGGLKGSIEFLPIEEITNCVTALQAQQSSRIEQLYQVTGMADIMRGQAEGDNKVSATEQQIKVKFASVRVQSIQDEFTRFATDMQRLRFEIICKHFDAETIVQNSGIMETADAQDPQILQQAIAMLKNTDLAKWRIQIQPESMAMVDYAQLKQERTEYINSLGIFLQSSFPVAEKFPEAAPILMELLKWGMAGFKGGKQIEGVLDRAIAAMEKNAQQQQGQPKSPSPEEMKVQAEIKRDDNKAQLEQQQSQQEGQLKLQEMQQEFQLKMAEMKQQFQQSMLEMKMEMEQAAQKHSHEMASNQMEMQNREHAMVADAAQTQNKIQAAQAQPADPGPMRITNE